MSYFLVFLFGVACGLFITGIYEAIRFDMMIKKMHKETMDKGLSLLNELIDEEIKQAKGRM